MPANPILVQMSSTGTSRNINLDWMAINAVTAGVTVSASNSACDFTIQYALNDLQTTTSTGVFWFSYSSAVGSSAQHFSNAVFDTGLTLQFVTPIGGIRLASTTLSSAAQVVSLRILQGGY